MALLKLDWRNVPSFRDLRGTFHRHLAEIDCDRGVHAIYLPTNDTENVKIHDATPSMARMMRQERITKYRALPKEEGPLRGQKKYAIAYLSVVRSLLVKIEARAMTYRRSITYEFANPSKGLRPDYVSDLVDDIALTLNLHPYCFGVRSEWKGQVYVPEGCQLDLWVVDDIFEYSDHKTTTSTRLGKGAHMIPGMISRLEVLSKGQSIRAVIVTEHRNVKAILGHFSGPSALPGLHGVMLVMLGGFADFAAREFLCLLYKHANMKQARFLFVSDCDASGLTIFAQCKYGSKRSAYASPIMVCPSLHYCGMSMSIIEEQVKQYATRQMEHKKRREVNMTSAQEAIARQSFVEFSEQKRRVIMRNDMTTNQKKEALQTLVSLERQGYFEDGKNKLAKECLLALKNGQATLSLFCVEALDPHGILYVLRDVVTAVLREVYNEVPVRMVLDHLAQAFVEEGSQKVPVPHARVEVDMDVEEDVAAAL